MATKNTELDENTIKDIISIYKQYQASKRPTLPVEEYVPTTSKASTASVEEYIPTPISKRKRSASEVDESVPYKIPKLMNISCESKEKEASVDDHKKKYVFNNPLNQIYCFKCNSRHNIFDSEMNIFPSYVAIKGVGVLCIKCLRYCPVCYERAYGNKIHCKNCYRRVYEMLDKIIRDNNDINKMKSPYAIKLMRELLLNCALCLKCVQEAKEKNKSTDDCNLADLRKSQLCEMHNKQDS